MNTVYTLRGPKGDVKIVDLNDNGVADSGDKIIIDDKEVEKFRTDPTVCERLKAMGVDVNHLGRSNLRPLTEYTEFMAAAADIPEAVYFDTTILQTEELLEYAWRRAGAAGVPFDHDLARQIRQKLDDAAVEGGRREAMAIKDPLNK